MSEHILELQKISKSFSGVEVLHEVTFALRPGEVHAILGENGAGKSTLVKIITGVHQPDHGEIFLHGAPVHFGDARDSRQAGIAAIYQELSLFPDLDVAENIFAGRLGEYTIESDPDLGLNVLYGSPFVYNADNIDDFDW